MKAKQRKESKFVSHDSFVPNAKGNRKQDERIITPKIVIAIIVLVILILILLAIPFLKRKPLQPEPEENVITLLTGSPSDQPQPPAGNKSAYPRNILDSEVIISDEPGPGTITNANREPPR